MKFAGIIAGAGFEVDMPVLYGSPVPEGGGPIARFLRLAREFRVLASDQAGGIHGVLRYFSGVNWGIEERTSETLSRRWRVWRQAT